MGEDAVLERTLERVRRALDADPPRSRWAQLATVDASGAARVRTLVLHEARAGGVLVFATDSASEKLAHLRERPRGEVCLLSRELLEQWRFLARFEEARLDERRAVWRALPPRERGYYVSPPPGLDRARFPESAFVAEAHGDEPAERFSVLLGRVEAIDRLLVATTPHRRFRYEKGAGWRERELSP